MRWSIVWAIAFQLMTAFAAVAAERPALSETAFEVDVSRPLDVSGKGDLRLMRSYFDAASWEYPIAPDTWKQLQRIGLRGVRLINVESNDAVRAVGADGRLSFDFSLLVPGLADCKKYKLKPHIVVGQRMQRALAMRGVATAFGIADRRAYENYAFALMKFVAVEQGFSNADFEVGNEPDTNGANWLLEGAHDSGSAQMYEAYFEMYEAWANAADRLARAYPNLRIRLGGPALTPYTLHFGGFEWARRFIGDVARRRLRLDFFSVHLYGDQQALRGVPSESPYPALAAGLADYKRLLKDNGLARVPLNVTEWGPCSHTDDSACGQTNGNEVGAAWTAKFVMQMADHDVDEATALILRDHKTDDGKRDNLSWPGYLLADAKTPKAMYNVARVFARMGDRRVSVSGGDDVTSALASVSASRVTVLVINQQWDFNRSVDNAPPRRINLSVQPLHTSNGRIGFVRYVIDRSHSNVYRKLQSGASNVAPELTPVERGTIDIVDGVGHLPGVTVEPSSISYWEIRVP